MYREVFRWLKKMGIRVSKNYLRLRLESHPDYPSLLAVKDTLEELHIPCDAYQTDKAHLQKENKPFLIHLNIGEGQLLYFNHIQEAEDKIRDLDKHWNGIVIMAEKPGKVGNAEHDDYLQKEGKQQSLRRAAVFLILSLFAGVAIWQHLLPVVLLIAANAVGLYFSSLIIQRELGIDNSLNDKICSIASRSHCDAVLFSKGAKLTKWVSWGDIGITYFTSGILYVFINHLSPKIIPFQTYSVISLFALLFPLYSLYYQWRIIKQWCMLCIGVVTVLFVNSVIGIIFFPPTPISYGLFISMVVFMFIATLLFVIWQLQKNVFQKRILSVTDKITLLRIKRDPNVFGELLEKGELDLKNFPQQNETISFGTLNAPIQITMACNPFCGPCAEAHQLLDGLLQKFPGKILVAIRFNIRHSDSRVRKVAATIEILKAAKYKPHDAIRDWYRLFDMTKFKQVHKNPEIDVSHDIEKQIMWSSYSKIRLTPTLFINGRKAPELYSWRECINFLEQKMNES